MYTKSISGLAECYYLAIPFFRNTVLGDLVYSGIFFGVYNLIGVQELLLNSAPRAALAQKHG